MSEPIAAPTQPAQELVEAPPRGVNWQRIADMPADRRDGRKVLIAEPPAQPGHPWYFYIARWAEKLAPDYPVPGWETTETLQGLAVDVAENAVTHWADLTPPAFVYTQGKGC